jgi:hypothetical protein
MWQYIINDWNIAAARDFCGSALTTDIPQLLSSQESHDFS